MSTGPAYESTKWRITGPHDGGSFTMAFKGAWIDAQFDSLESALSWRRDTDLAERLWSEQTKRDDYTPLPKQSASYW